LEKTAVGLFFISAVAVGGPKKVIANS
jgi:hypothetical protein